MTLKRYIIEEHSFDLYDVNSERLVEIYYESDDLDDCILEYNKIQFSMASIDSTTSFIFYDTKTGKKYQQYKLSINDIKE